MNTQSLRLKIVLPGRTMLTEQEAKEQQNYTTFIIKPSKAIPKAIRCKMRGCKPAFQSLTIDAKTVQDFMSDTIPSFASKDWKYLSQAARLDKHLQILCQQLGGISYTYQFIEDYE